MATFFLLFIFLFFYLFRYFLAFYSFRSKRLPENIFFLFSAYYKQFSLFFPRLARLLQYGFQAPANAGGITAYEARGRGFEPRLCRQRWQSSSEDRARNNFSTSSCQSAPTGGCRQDYIVWKQRVRFPPPETAKSCQSSRPPFLAAWKNKCFGNYIGRRFESCPAPSG